MEKTIQKLIKKALKKSNKSKQLFKVTSTLRKISNKVVEFKKTKEKSLVLLRTDRTYYKDELEHSFGFGFNDLKPQYQKLYKILICEYNIDVKMVDPTNFIVELVLNKKK